MKSLLKNKKNLISVLAGGAIVLVLLLAGVLQKEENASQAPETEPLTTTAAVTEAPEETAAPVQTEAAEEIPAETVEIVEYVNNEIQTPWFTLYYPEAFADHLVVANTAEEPFTLEFYAMLEERPEQRIFDIRLGKNIEGNMGMVKTGEGDILVDLKLFAFNPDSSWTEGEIDTVLAMQDAANDMLEQLDLQEAPEKPKAPVVEETAPESSVVNATDIRTPYCTLSFPVIWKDNLVVEQQEREDGVYEVKFYGKVQGKPKCLLFSILFGGDEGEQLGAVMTDSDEFVTVNLEMEALSVNGWREKDVQTLYSMQEAVNELILQLPLEE